MRLAFEVQGVGCGVGATWLGGDSHRNPVSAVGL